MWFFGFEIWGRRGLIFEDYLRFDIFRGEKITWGLKFNQAKLFGV